MAYVFLGMFLTLCWAYYLIYFGKIYAGPSSVWDTPVAVLGICMGLGMTLWGAIGG